MPYINLFLLHEQKNKYELQKKFDQGPTQQAPSILLILSLKIV